jgi:hypothetical protein
LTSVDLDYFVLEETRPSILGHLLHVKPNILRTIDSRKQAWSHARVVVVRGGADESDFVAALNILGEIQENSEVRVPASDQNKMLTHKSPAQYSRFVPSHSYKQKNLFMD